MQKYEYEDTYIICENQQQQNDISDKLIKLGFFSDHFKPNYFDELPTIQIGRLIFGNYKIVNKINASCVGMITPIKQLHISDF